MTDRVPGAPGQYTMIVAASEAQKILTGEAVTVTLTRDDQPLVEGTPYNKASVLPDDLAAKICPDVTDPTPADAYEGLIPKIVEKILPLSGWSSSAPYIQTISVSEVGENHTPHICLIPSDDVSTALAQEEAWGCVSRGVTKNKTITFTCYEDKPSMDIPIQIEVKP